MGLDHKWFGNLSRQNGYYEHQISPFQQNLFKGFFNPGAKKFAFRLGRQALFALPPMAFYYYLSQWATETNNHYHTKAYLKQHGGEH
ncbi:hypothetical protein CcCBS67573_g00853 [Chytriomyces confervae]|uniref:Cytochrome b-c1 complex subunit 8 n=1 Tax=Chytriomyces confervae TaxID=246404 RepID=A0A507FNP0_9FUNG|nr:hypothetical protein HDU80_000645 [Chytriomyces hyalinus]TPX77882.1 hypothetical protein CcCBS67573_g00853 [Chytriomyces confervae]